MNFLKLWFYVHMKLKKLLKNTLPWKAPTKSLFPGIRPCCQSPCPLPWAPCHRWLVIVSPLFNFAILWICCTFLFCNWSQLCVMSEISQVWQNFEIYLAGLASWLLVSEHLYLSTPPSSLSLARWAWQIHVFMINLNVQHYLSSYLTLGIGLLVSTLAFLGCCGALTTSRSPTWLWCWCWLSDAC